MLKHPTLTIGRIANFIKTELEERIIANRWPLTIEFCGEPHATEKDAAKGSWQPVEPGFRYGPAYRTVWFRLTGSAPKQPTVGQFGVLPNLGSERTVWKDNSPWQGVDGFHQVCPLLDLKPGGAVRMYIQAYTTNPQCRVAGRELPREELVETVEGAWLVDVDLKLQELFFDCTFTFDLMKALPESDPAYHVLLRALNAVCNSYRRGDAEVVARCRKVLKDALGSLPGEVRHSITPVGHAHLDTAWLWPLEITHKKMAHTTANQLRLMEKYPEYVFVHSQASQYEWLEQEYPSLFRQVKDRIASGQWEPVGSMWVEADCNLTGSESLVRQFLYGRRYFRDKLGYETEDMWLPDVFGYSAALPQILNKFGIKYFLTQKISWNQFNKFPHNTFWWQGIDGTRIWSHFPPADTYIGDCSPTQLTQSVQKHRDHARSDHSLYVFGWGDGGGGPTENHLEMLRRAKMTGSMPDVQFGRRAIDFFHEAKAKGRDLMTWDGELYFELHRGTYTSQAANKKGNRECEFLLRDAELLSVFRDDFPKAYPGAELERLWKLVLLNQFHDIIPGSSVREVYVDSDRDYAEIRSSGKKLVDAALARIGSKMDTSAMSAPLAVFHNSTVASQVSVPWAESDVPNSIETPDGVLPAQLVDEFGSREIIFETPVSALGAVSVCDLSDAVSASKGRLRASSRRIENDQWSVKFDGNGNIVSIQSLDDGTEFIEQGKLGNMFQLFDDVPNFWTAWDVDAFALETGRDLVKSESFELVERGPVRVAVMLTKTFGQSTIRQKISLGPTPGIRFDTEIDWHETDKMLKVAFPVNVHSARATYEIQFGNVERPTHYNTTWDMARFEVCAQKWVDLSEADQGVALINDCKYGHDVHKNVMRMTLLRSPKAPDPECDMGVHRFSYVLLPHYGPYNYAGVVQAAYALNAQPRVCRLEPSKGQDGQIPQFVSCDDRNVVVETVKKAEDSNAIIVRLYECHNARGHSELTCLRTVKKAQICDLEERPIGDLDIVDGIVLFEYKPFEIITIRLEV